MAASIWSRAIGPGEPHAVLQGNLMKMLVLALLVSAFLYMGLLFLFQEKQIYFPDNPTREKMLAEVRRLGLAPWPDDEGFRGLLREPTGRVRGTVVMFHGNAGHAGHREWYAGVFIRFGLRLILAEYPAYGSRDGSLGEKSLVADAQETLAMARQRFPGPLLLAGESLGAGVAAAAAKSSGADAVLLITPWDRIQSVARHHFPWLPVGLLLRDRYDSSGNLSGYRGRVAVVIAGRDSIVPPEFGSRLFEDLSEPKRLWVVPAADHNDWMDRVDAVWWQSVVDFLVDG
ncbi:MAG: alpha/beta hydrolase [Thermodesulfobacteriota bacterium]